ncbi:MAG: efflux RND transporter periplasmic adaptor subunit [Bryobacterales bacterium]|nr:efflux RND transporter periplasmic adaptor subunit [Bryobacterales bacterium]
MTMLPTGRSGLWITLIIVVLLVGCKQQVVEKPAESKAQETVSDPMEIKTPPQMRGALKLGEATWAEVGTNVTVAAHVEVDETRVTRVGAPVMGRISSLAVREGQEVQRGQLLALLTSTGLSDAQLSFLKALSQKQVAQRAVDRAQLLLRGDVIGVAELQRRESEFAQATAELDAAHDQLILLGMPDEAISELQRTRSMNSVSRIVASMDGTVLDRRITLGQVVQPADTAFEIADLSHLWMLADVPETNAGHLAEGQAVEAQIAALPGATIHGKLSFVSATVNPETRTVRVRMDLPNPKRRFKPAMLATMVLKEHTERRQMVPLSAIVREGNTEYLFVQRANETFVLREVQFGVEIGGRREVLNGLKPGESIVLDGAFHLNNERRRRAQRGVEGS